MGLFTKLDLENFEDVDIGELERTLKKLDLPRGSFRITVPVRDSEEAYLGILENKILKKRIIPANVIYGIHEYDDIEGLRRDSFLRLTDVLRYGFKNSGLFPGTAFKSRESLPDETYIGHILDNQRLDPSSHPDTSGDRYFLEIRRFTPVSQDPLPAREVFFSYSVKRTDVPNIAFNVILGGDERNLEEKEKFYSKFFQNKGVRFRIWPPVLN
ncbi:hypothetical protein D6829_00620 [Candidatus Pacearchaeota archaeon]|nr:MAG: hypothetical protein D6829_00620 [Candidatus Pacearchaeota archaeon]